MKIRLIYQIIQLNDVTNQTLLHSKISLIRKNEKSTHKMICNLKKINLHY